MNGERSPESELLVEKLDLPAKVALLTGADVWRTAAEPDIGLRPVVFSDGPAGVRGEGWDERANSILLPAPIAVAASWDAATATALGGLLAAEAHRKGVHVVLAPTLNLHRSPLSGRHFECFAEDPLLAARTGAALVRAIQAGGVAATAKHLVANDSETGRLGVDVRVDERALREVYLAPFEAAVRAGVRVVMTAYGGVGGHPMSSHPMLRSVLKDEWGFEGVVVSDWGAVRSLDPAAAGLDLAMPDGPWGHALVAAVRSGELDESVVDDKVRRLLELARWCGALGRRTRRRIEPSLPRTVLRKAVAAGTVLLHNRNETLPLGSVRMLAVLGPKAATPRAQGGGSAGVYPSHVVSLVDGLRAALPFLTDVCAAPGVRLDEGPTPVDAVRVRVLDVSGRELLTEHRHTGRVLEPTLVAGAATVELHAVLRPEVSGPWTVSVAGWNRVTLRADDHLLVDEDVPRDTDDPAVVHLTPPYRSAVVELVKGTEVHLVASRAVDPDSGRACVLAADPPPVDEDRLLAEAVSLARSADAAVVVVGTTATSEREGEDRTTLALPGRQDELVRAVAAVNPRTVVVVNAGGPVLLPWRDEVGAVLVGWLPGQEGGHGLADVLLGFAEPGGRLPVTWPDRDGGPSVTPVDGVLDYTEGLDIGYRGWLAAEAEPAYWFGHGLGYTTWTYERIRVPPAVDGSFTVQARVRNTGSRPGREVVQVYLSRSDGDHPVRWLAGYAAVTADPGEAVDVSIAVPRRALEHWSGPGGWCLASGPLSVLVGRNANDLPRSAATRVAAR
ncbi:glycoside hydrolase family 3 C-terminal domain-containing protein [Labedaea rhizosphaerae]|uniref:Beta-glucosidase n=1 Tax=Labedaea rhizosphaerae TaxID=598644 RepID=A0A4R6SIR6_LABRH|nr:glycoside hydrolase family 3 C-terminal domain-containing protein [Labedaea rhizosphaerae]TDQ01537.1 beta-glucosidase [Labedaea rhizosphaerae]